VTGREDPPQPQHDEHRGAGVSELDRITKSWATAYTEEVLQYAKPATVNDMEVFADVYHSLIHSPLSLTLLQLEASYAAVVESLCRERDLKLSEMEARHCKEITETVAAATNNKNPGTGGVSEQDVNALATFQIDEKELLASKYESEIGSLQEQQHKEFRSWVMTVHEELKTTNNVPKGNFPRSESGFSMSSQPEVMSLQESFTIILGAQMKQMHNLRVSAGKVLDLCRYSAGEEALPQRLQTSMSLYSNNLCGLVLLTDARLQSVSGLQADFARLCRRSTEFHFPSLEVQLENIRTDVKKAANWRKEFWTKKAEAEAEYNNGENCSLDEISRRDFSVLQPGDFYLTKHSNLCENHVVFHMVTDHTEQDNNISSRHPVIIGMRNILKTSCLNDVTSLTIPLLLAHSMTEKMTVAWCLKRAELVFKCIKGFMMEMGGWGGTEIKTLQFLLPHDIDQDVFIKLTAMLSTIFRVANPIREKSLSLT